MKFATFLIDLTQQTAREQLSKIINDAVHRFIFEYLIYIRQILQAETKE